MTKHTPRPHSKICHSKPHPTSVYIRGLRGPLYPFNTGGQPKCRGRGGLTNALGPVIILLATRRKDSETKPTKQASNAKTTESRREVEEQRASGRSGIQREGIEYML